MRGILVRWLINTVALLATASIIKGIEVKGVWGALVAAGVLGIVNAFIRPVLILLTLPFNVLTLGLLTFAINGLMMLLVAKVVDGFVVHGFWAAVVGSLLLSLISGFISMVVTDR
ncbi:MAG: phage holin family protein [Firmicutes bacterium]|jgi:putative membrane protein|nr:phage holin family protein [Bacillota bacterium]